MRLCPQLSVVGICSVFLIPCYVLAQDVPVPGVLSGVGTDATRTEAAALNNSTALQGNADTPRLAPPTDAVAESLAAVKTVETIVFEGDTAFAEKQNIGKRFNTALAGGASAGEALSAINKELINNGFYLARLILKAYDEASRTLTVQVDSGVFGKVSVTFQDREGEGRWFSKRQIERRFSDLREGDTFDYRALYRRLAEVNASPDLTLDTDIKVRSDVVGEGDNRYVVRSAGLEFLAKEAFPFHAMLEINNYATKELDEWQGQLTFQYLNLTRADDVLTVSPGMTLNGDLLTLAGSYMRPHYLLKGGSTTLYGGYSDLNSDNVVPRVDLAGTGWFGGLAETFKLVENDRSLLSLSGGILYRYIEDQFSAHVGGHRLSLQQRNVSVLPFSLSLSYADRQPDFLRGRNFATLTGVFNLWAGGNNSLDQMWYGAEENYKIARLQLARLQPLFGTRDAKENPIRQWTLYFRAEGQYSPDPLIPAEKLFLGGYQTVRGYTTKSVLGDTGAYGTIELRTPILLDTFAQVFRTKRDIPFDRLQLLVFCDAGYTRQEKPLPGSLKSEPLLSAGAGARFALTKYSQFRFDYGFPLIKIDSDEDSRNSSGAFYVSGQLQF